MKRSFFVIVFGALIFSFLGVYFETTYEKKSIRYEKEVAATYSQPATAQK